MMLRRLAVPFVILATSFATTAALAVTTVAANAGAPARAAAHDQTFADVDTEGDVPDAAVDIVSTHVFTTATEYRAVVSYRRYTRLKATRYNIELVSDAGGRVSGNVLDFRVDPSGKAALIGYGIGPRRQLVKSACRGNKVLAGTNTLTFVVSSACWYSSRSPDVVVVGTRHYASAAAYAKGGPNDTFAAETPSVGNDRSDDADLGGWDWGGPQDRPAHRG